MKLKIKGSIKKESKIGITIGSFDGVHKGHQFLIKRFQEQCKLRNLSGVVVSFDPHPSIYIENKENFLINSSHKKRKFLKETYDINLVEIEFNDSVKKMSGEEFFKELYILLPNIKFFYAGHDFALGANKSFDFKKAKQQLLDIELFQEEKFELNQNHISSTQIREHLTSGEIKKSNFYLGHIFTLTGKVIHGRKVGRALGFPTANLSFDSSQLLPENGVYCTRCRYKGKLYRSIVNIGTRPTITDDLTRLVEVNVFDFNHDIYGEEIDIEFYYKIRDERKFASREELISQIEADKEISKTFSFYGEMGLLGAAIKHSRSEIIYKKLIPNEFLSYKLIDCLDITYEQLSITLRSIPYLSITAPHKNKAFKLVDNFFNNKYELDSINAIKKCGNKIVGTNTDALALEKILALEDFSNKEIIVLGDGSMGKILSKILDMMNHTYQVLSRKKNNLDKLTQLNGENYFIINALAREFTPVLNSATGGTFWDLNYSQSYEEELQKNKLIKYRDGLELLSLQASFALSFWNLKAD